MHIPQENQHPINKVKNTFSTDSSKRQNQIEHDLNFKSERQKYLQQRLNRRKQVKQVRKQKFGSSSSESEKSIQKPKLAPKIIKDFQVIKPLNVVESNKKNEEEQFHAKHQAYIKEKMARKKQLLEQRRKQFGSSSSDSDDDLVVKKMDGVKMQSVIEISKQEDDLLQVPKQESRNSPVKRSLGSTTNDNNTRAPIIVQQIVYTKGQKAPQTKKLTILVQSKKNLQWIEQTLVIQNKRIKLLNQNIQLMIGYVTKIKLLFTNVSKDYLKMKLSLKDQDYFFGVSSKKLIDNLPQYYYLFAKIIQEKLTQIGFQPKKNQSSIFPNCQNLKDAPMWLKKNAIVFGNVLKKSQILGNWETRFVYIAEKQIGSGKRPIDKPSMTIQTDSILGLWTRFDIENNNMLNIKIMYNSNTKTQFGIPINHYIDEYNWLYSFYRIIKPRP